MGNLFNLQMNDLPTSIKKLVIHKCSNFAANLNCLPDSIEELHLNYKYKKRILKIPLNLKKLICSENYPYINDFVMQNVQIY